jgi:hypothetical protein
LETPYGKRSPRTLWQEYQDALRAAQAIISKNMATLPAFGGVCKLCHWYTACVGRLKEANDLQSSLNAEYATGRQVLEDTYKPAIIQNFGQAAGAAFDNLLSGIESTGKAIASIQASISNEQAVQQTKQYNFQLFIALPCTAM